MIYSDPATTFMRSGAGYRSGLESDLNEYEHMFGNLNKIPYNQSKRAINPDSSVLKEQSHEISVQLKQKTKQHFYYFSVFSFLLEIRNIIPDPGRSTLGVTVSFAVFVDLDDFCRGELEPTVAANLTPHAQGSLRFLRDLVGS